jgi:hypothetical protein
MYVRKHGVFDVQPNNLLTSVLKNPVYSAPIECEETLQQLVFDACQTIRNRLGTFQSVRQSMIRGAHAWTDAGGGGFGRLL